MFHPADFNQGEKSPAIIVTGAWTTDKEQMPTTYAKKLAEDGFVTLVFDFRGWGESDGENRYLEDPVRKTEDIMAAASFLKSRPEVDASRVGGLGVCARSGYMVKAYAEGAFKSVSLVAPWLHDRQIATQVYGGEESVANLLALSDTAAAHLEATGEFQAITAASTTDEGSLMYNAPYYTEADRGLIEEYDNQFNVASWRPWLTFDAIQYADRIPGRILFVESESMALPQGSAAFKTVAGDLIESVNLPEVSQFDFYDRVEPVKTAVEAVSKFMDRELLGFGSLKRGRLWSPFSYEYVPADHFRGHFISYLAEVTGQQISDDGDSRGQAGEGEQGRLCHGFPGRGVLRPLSGESLSCSDQ